MSKAENWLEYTDKEYDAMAAKWRYTWDVFTGEYSDTEHVKDYLSKRADWEKDASYNLRISAADPDMLFSTIIGSIVGQLFAVEPQEKRIWQKDGTEGLGNPNDPTTIIGRLWDNADGEGTSWPVLWRQFATHEILFQSMYVLVEGIEMRPMVDDDGIPAGEEQIGEARIKLIDPLMVLSKGYKDGRLSWVKVKHVEIEGDDGPETKQEERELYTVYTLDGWQRYEKAKGKAGVPVLIDEGFYDFYETNERQARCLPIFLVRFPFPAYVAHYLARKAIVIFNQESQRDSFLGEATTVTEVDEADPMVFEAHQSDRRAGESAMNVEAGKKIYYIAPPEGPARLATDVLEDKRKNLFISAYQQYADAAAQTTATEIRQDARAGIEAFLSLFSASVEEAQNRATFLLEQVYFPDSPDLWGGAKVELSRDFVPADPAAQDNALRDMFFGPSPLPASSEMLQAVAVRLYEGQGFELTEDERTMLRATVDAYTRRRDGLRPGLENRANQLQGLLTQFNGGN